MRTEKEEVLEFLKNQKDKIVGQIFKIHKMMSVIGNLMTGSPDHGFVIDAQHELDDLRTKVLGLTSLTISAISLHYPEKKEGE